MSGILKTSPLYQAGKAIYGSKKEKRVQIIRESTKRQPPKNRAGKVSGSASLLAGAKSSINKSKEIL